MLNNVSFLTNGYNIKTQTIVDMKEAGIIDPQKVTKNANYHCKPKNKFKLN